MVRKNLEIFEFYFHNIGSYRVGSWCRCLSLSFLLWMNEGFPFSAVQVHCGERLRREHPLLQTRGKIADEKISKQFCALKGGKSYENFQTAYIPDSTTYHIV